MNSPTIFVMDFTVISAWALDRPPNGLELDTPGIESYSSIPGTANNKQRHNGMRRQREKVIMLSS